MDFGFGLFLFPFSPKRNKLPHYIPPHLPYLPIKLQLKQGSDFLNQTMAGTTKRVILRNAEATRELGRILGRSLPAGTVILLEGDLGSGKTTLVQGLGEGLGIQETIDSPTFTLINEYLDGRLPLYHIDLYRLTMKEAASLYLEAYWEGAEFPLGIMAIEWAERLPYPPENPLKISLKYGPEAGRQVILTESNQAQTELLEGLRVDEILANEI